MLIDGMQCGFYDRQAFEGLRQGGVSAVTVTCGFWEDALESLDSLAKWRDLVRENADLAVIARGAADIEAAHRDGKVAVLLGFQNINCLQGRIRYVEFWAELGVRVLQLTYNNQTEAGGSCYEERDGGLTRFGREVVREMNRNGMVVDLSHVGPQTSLEVIEHSEKPVAVTHSNAMSLYHHKRSKSDELLKALAAKGGIMGCATYPNLVGDEYGASLEKWCEMVARTVDIMGIDHVALGTDRRYNAKKSDLDWVRMGRWTRGIDYGAGSATRAAPNATPTWCRDLEQFDCFASGLARAGFSAAEVEALTAGNWLRFYREVMGG